MGRKSTRVWAKTTTLAVAFVTAIGWQSPARAENLADALIGAYNTSGLLEQNRALLRAADEDVATAVALLRPVIDFIATANARDGRFENAAGIDVLNRTAGATLGFDLSWLLFDNGVRNLSIQATKEAVLEARQRLLSIEQQILFRAVVAYMDVILQTENVSLRENNLRVLGEELRAAQDRFDVGEVTRTDVAQAESRVASARSNLALARGLLVNAQAEYVNAVGRKPGKLVTPTRLPPQPRSIEATQAVAVRTHPNILEAQRRVASLELLIEQARKRLGPSLSGTLSARLLEDRGRANNGYDTAIGLRFAQPIYQGGALQSNIRSAMARRDAARANLLTVQRNTVQDANNAFVRRDTARATLVATAERVRAAQVAFDGTREEATLGARTTLDVLISEQELLDALTAQIEARTQEWIAAYELLAAQGLLTAERLGLAVQIYDPTIYYNLVKTAPATVSKQSKDLDRVLKALGKP